MDSSANRVATLVASIAAGVATGCTGNGGVQVGLWYDETVQIPENTAMAAPLPRGEIARVSLEFPGLVCDHVVGTTVEGSTQQPIRQEDVELALTVVTLHLPKKQPSHPHLEFFEKERPVGTFEFRITPCHTLETYTGLACDGPVVYLRDYQVELAELHEDQKATLSPKDRVTLWNGRSLVSAVRADLVVETPGLYELRTTPCGLGWITQGGQPPQEDNVVLMESQGKLGLMVSPSTDSPFTLELLRK
jgi:hypothetical protein